MSHLNLLFKKYFLKNLKLTLTIILTVFIYIWIDNIIYNNKGLDLDLFPSPEPLLQLIFLKPIFVYIGGLIIINKIN